MGISEMIEGPELAGLLGLVPAVGSEEVVPPNVTCAAGRLWTSPKAACCKGEAAESGQSCCGVPERCGQSSSLRFSCQLNVFI